MMAKFLLLALGLSIMFVTIIVFFFWLPNRDMKCLSFTWFRIAFVTNIHIHGWVYAYACACLHMYIVIYVLTYPVLNRKEEALETCRLWGRLAPGFHSTCHLNAFCKTFVPLLNLPELWFLCM